MTFVRVLVAASMLFGVLATKAWGNEGGGEGKSEGGARGGRGGGTTLFLAASLQPVLLSMEERHGVDVRLVPASSGLLARQIAAGAPADLYITADRKWTAWLEGRGVALLRSKTFLSNRLALVEPATPSKREHDETQDEAQDEGQTEGHSEETLSRVQSRALLLSATRIAVGDPSHVPVGFYARQLFESLTLDDSAFLKKLVPLVNTRATMLHIERGEASLGIVYRSDALFAKRIVPPRVRIVGYPSSDLYAPIAYDLVLLEERGRALYDFLAESSDARETFLRFGFIPL